MPLRDLKSSERGASAILIAFAMVLMLGLAAIAIDLALGFNERRVDQIAGDVGVMAGALQFLDGEQAITEEILEYVWLNLPNVTGATWDTDTDYRDAFRGCVDPDMATFGLSLGAVAEPAINGVWNGVGNGTGALPCISVSPLGFVRVRVPDQFTDTSFGRLLGVSQLRTSAGAVAQVGGGGRLGILPFGLPSGAGGGDHLCLSSAPTGLADDPCTGPASGNFGTLKLPLWGNPEVGTTQNCNSAPLGQTLAINIAVGADHVIFLAPSTSASDEIRDDPANCGAKTFGVNTLDTDTGFPGTGAQEGLIGPLPGSAPASSMPRLLRSTMTTPLFGVNIDDKPLWDYLDPSVDGDFPLVSADGSTNAPESCDPDTFDNALNATFMPSAGWPYAVPGDWNDDGVVDLLESWEHMKFCFDQWNTGSYTVLFTEDIQMSPRFSYTPQFWESTLGSGGSSWPHVKQFRAVFIQGTFWKKGNKWSVHHPGEGCDTSGGGSCASNESLQQISGFVIPDLALPLDLRGNPPPYGNINPFNPLLYK